jgi:hypothetical protein
VDNFVENVPCELSEGPWRGLLLDCSALLALKNIIKIKELNGFKWAPKQIGATSPGYSRHVDTFNNPANRV